MKKAGASADPMIPTDYWCLGPESNRHDVAVEGF